MSNSAKDEEREKNVNRLHDIVVEEVSLVDRAANKHRFLIVKRSDEMNDDTTDAADATPEGLMDLNAESEEAEGEGVDDEGADDEDAAGGETHPENEDPSEAAGDDATLALAVEALEGLTETVEMLGGSGGAAARTRLAELAGELRGVSEQLALAVTGTDKDEQGTEADEDAGRGDDLATTIGAVRTTLQRVGTLLRAREKPSDATATIAEQKPRTEDTKGAQRAEDAEEPEASASTGASDKLGTQLEALTTELRSLHATVKEQQQRLARLEKRFGMPNSRAAGERPARIGSAENDDAGWPLDMNRSLDRESVDKATSFHEL